MSHGDLIVLFLGFNWVGFSSGGFNWVSSISDEGHQFL
jgi:hypothetical protein